MNLLIKSAAGLLFLVFGLGIALVVRNLYLWHQDLVGPYALPTLAGAMWLAHQVALALVCLAAMAGTFAKRWWGGDALALAFSLRRSMSSTGSCVWTPPSCLAEPSKPGTPPGCWPSMSALPIGSSVKTPPRIMAFQLLPNGLGFGPLRV